MTRKVRLKSQPFLTLLEQHNMSLREFGRNEDISSAFLTQLLNGDRYAGARVRQRIQEATGLEWDDLFETVPDGLA